MHSAVKGDWMERKAGQEALITESLRSNNLLCIGQGNAS